MDEDDRTGTGPYTTKEMLVRLDGKLDVVIGKQQHYDVEMALLKARVSQQEEEFRVGLRRAHDEMRAREKDESEWRTAIRNDVESVQAAQSEVIARQKVTTYLVGAFVIVANIVTPIILRHL